jgi:hypothetical protein
VLLLAQSSTARSDGLGAASSIAHRAEGKRGFHAGAFLGECGLCGSGGAGLRRGVAPAISSSDRANLLGALPIERLAVEFTEHPTFDTPGHTETLWRYLDLPKFMALLERRALFFAGVSTFPDRFEGSLTRAAIEELERQGGNAVDHRLWHRATYVNCWNLDSDESAALWSMYASPAGGVAIKSSVGSLIRAFRAGDSEETASRDQLMIGRVRYLD